MIETFTYLSSPLKPLGVYALKLPEIQIPESIIYREIRKNVNFDIPTTVDGHKLIFCSEPDEAEEYAKLLKGTFENIISETDQGNQESVPVLLNTPSKEDLNPLENFSPYRKLVFEATRRNLALRGIKSVRVKRGNLSYLIDKETFNLGNLEVEAGLYLSLRTSQFLLGGRLILTFDTFYRTFSKLNDDDFAKMRKKYVILCKSRYEKTINGIAEGFEDVNRFSIRISDQLIQFDRVVLR